MIFFLDRDGTINVDHNFVHKKEEWTFCDGAPEAIRLLNEAGYYVVVVTNQTGIIRGNFTLAQVEALHRWVDEELAKHGARIDAWYIAPWRPNMHEDRHPALLHDRKPGTGMFERAMIRYDAASGAANNAKAGASDRSNAVLQSARKRDDTVQKPTSEYNSPASFVQNPVSEHKNTDTVQEATSDRNMSPSNTEKHLSKNRNNTVSVYETVRINSRGEFEITQIETSDYTPSSLEQREEIGLQIGAKYADQFAKCAMAGDKITDLEPALKLGIKPLFIKSVWFSEKDSEWLKKNNIPIFERLIDAVNSVI